MVSIDLKNKGYEEDSFFDVFYVIDLSTRKILDRIDPDSIEEVEELAATWIKDFPEIEIVQALKWQEKD